MKKIFTLAALLISITSFSFAAGFPKPGKLTVSSSERGIIQVRIDGVMYNLNRNTFVMDNIRPGNHNVTIYKTENGAFRKRMQVIYNSNVYISPSQLVDINVNRGGGVVVNSSSPNRYDRDGHYYGNDRSYDNHNSHDRNDDRDNHYDRH